MEITLFLFKHHTSFINLIITLYFLDLKNKTKKSETNPRKFVLKCKM